MITITRKVQIYIDGNNVKEDYERWRRYSRICDKAANMICTSQYIQENVKDLFFFEDGTKKKLADIKKDADGILSTSAPNTTYQLLSKHFKGDCPMAMLSALNLSIVKTYKKEALEVKKGKRSLRSYRQGVPMPVPSRNCINWVKGEDGNYSFTAFDTSFKTFFGRDLSGNELIFDNVFNGSYKLCDSSVIFDGRKMFGLFVFQFEQQKVKLDDRKEYKVILSNEVPVKVEYRKNIFTIGTKDEYSHRVEQIRRARYAASINARYRKGGKGRKKKMQSLDRYSEMERNYVRTKVHQYTYQIVSMAVKNKVGKVIIDSAEADNMIPQFLFNEVLLYKCKKFGIELINQSKEVAEVD